MTELADLAARLAEFACRRDWEQFHTPKNLAMAIGGEAGELLAELQWFTGLAPSSSRDRRRFGRNRPSTTPAAKIPAPMSISIMVRLSLCSGHRFGRANLVSPNER